MTAMEALFPWPDINFGLDEQWARLSPYEAMGEAGRTLALQAVVFNHSRTEQELVVSPQLPRGWKSDRASYRAKLKPKAEGVVDMQITPTSASGRYVVTADIEFAGMRLRQWTEAIVKI
jgi:hypothetical protein